MYLAAKGGFIYSTVHYKISLSRASLDQKSSSSAFICLKIGVSQRRKCTASMEVHSRPRARGTRSHGHAKDDGGSTLLRAHTARGSENVGGREGNSKGKQVSGEENQRAASDRNSHGSLPPPHSHTGIRCGSRRRRRGPQWPPPAHARPCHAAASCPQPASISKGKLWCGGAGAATSGRD